MSNGMKDKIESLRAEARAEYRAATQRMMDAVDAMRALGLDAETAPLEWEAVGAALSVLGGGAENTSADNRPANNASPSLPMFSSEPAASAMHLRPSMKRHVRRDGITRKIMRHLTDHGPTQCGTLSSVVYEGDPRAMELISRPINRLISHGYVARDNGRKQPAAAWVCRVTDAGRTWWAAVLRGEALVPNQHGAVRAA